MTTQLQTVLCPICRQGRRAGSLQMPKHRVTAWEECFGSGFKGSLPEEVGHRIRGARFALVSSPAGTIVQHRWICDCGQMGSCVTGEETAWHYGRQHVAAMERRDR